MKVKAQLTKMSSDDLEVVQLTKSNVTGITTSTVTSWTLPKGYVLLGVTITRNSTGTSDGTPTATVKDGNNTSLLSTGELGRSATKTVSPAPANFMYTKSTTLKITYSGFTGSFGISSMREVYL